MRECFIKLLSKRCQLNEETIEAIIIDIFSWVHEVSYKKGVSEAIIESYREFGEAVCWHLFGLIMESYKDDEYCNDAKGELLTGMQYFNVQMLKRFKPILDKWEIEKKWELETNTD